MAQHKCFFPEQTCVHREQLEYSCYPSGERLSAKGIYLSRQMYIPIE